MAARTSTVLLIALQLLSCAWARVPAGSSMWDSVQVIPDRTLQASTFFEEEGFSPAKVTKFHIPDLPDTPRVTAENLEDKYVVCLDTPTQRFGLKDPEEDDQPDAIWVKANGDCELEEYCGGLTGDWSVDASDRNNIGISEAALQMLSLNDDEEGFNRASEFLRDLRNLANLDIITQDDGGITRAKNIEKASAACAHLIKVTMCQA